MSDRKKQRELLIAAAELLISVSTSTLKRVLTGDHHSPGVSPRRLKELHAAVEALCPTLVERAKRHQQEERFKIDPNAVETIWKNKFNAEGGAK